MKRLQMLSIGIAFSLILSVVQFGENSQTAYAQIPNIHFKCYPVDNKLTQPIKGVKLEDQFDKKRGKPDFVTVTSLEKICTPANKNDRNKPIPEKPHYTVYKIEGGAEGEKIRVSDQFHKKGVTIRLGNAIMLFTWAWKWVEKDPHQLPPNPPAIEQQHLKCYEITRKIFQSQFIGLFDQFFPKGEHVSRDNKGLQLFCASTMKNDTGVNVPDLLCYPLIKTKEPLWNVFLWDQFITKEKVKPKPADMFCQGALKDPAIGGELLPINTTALFIYTISANLYWILPMVGGISGAAIIIKRIKNRNSHN